LLNDLRAVVEVVPVVAGAHPVVVGGGVVGLVVGVSRGVVELAGLGVLAGGLGVEGGGGLTVEDGEHLPPAPRRSSPSPQRVSQPLACPFAIQHAIVLVRPNSPRAATPLCATAAPMLAQLRRTLHARERRRYASGETKEQRMRAYLAR